MVPHFQALTFSCFFDPCGRPGPRLGSRVLAKKASRSSVLLFLLPLGLRGLRLGATGISAIAASRSKVFLFLLPLGRPGLRFGSIGSSDFGLGERLYEVALPATLQADNEPANFALLHPAFQVFELNIENAQRVIPISRKEPYRPL